MNHSKTWAERETPIDRDLRTTTVARTLWPGMAGTVALQCTHGEQLVCVRYRHDLAHTVRFTTIELLVDEKRIRIRPQPDRIYGVRIDWQEKDLTQRARASGGVWDDTQKLWRLSGKTVLQLGIGHRIRQR